MPNINMGVPIANPLNADIKTLSGANNQGRRCRVLKSYVVLQVSGYFADWRTPQPPVKKRRKARHRQGYVVGAACYLAVISEVSVTRLESGRLIMKVG